MNKRLLYHVVFWAAYWLFESYVEFAWISASFAAVPVPSRFLMAALGEATLLLIKIPVIYALLYTTYTLAPKLKTPVIPFLLWIVTLTIGITVHRILILKIILPHLYMETDLTEGLFQTNRVISALLDMLFVVIMAIAGKLYRLRQQWKEQEKALLKDKLEAELKFLRTQTNPHFLFNTLNNIYALARKKSDATADVVMKLSKLLRFMLYESRKDSITIVEELRVLDDYIELERIRYNDRLQVNFSRSVDLDTERIAPLILLPFVENAFKHGASETRFDSYITINVELIKGELLFHVENSKDGDTEGTVTENIGLSNVRRQLELMYPGHQLRISNEKTRFIAHLTLNLHQHATV